MWLQTKVPAVFEIEAVMPLFFIFSTMALIGSDEK